VAQVTERQPSKHEALNSNPSNIKKQKQKKKKFSYKMILENNIYI
jgi:hypothetical protein